jgi:hypothetical protein
MEHHRPMKTAFSSSEGCTQVGRGQKNVEEKKTKIGYGRSPSRKARKTGRTWGVLRKEASVFEDKNAQMLCLKP